MRALAIGAVAMCLAVWGTAPAHAQGGGSPAAGRIRRSTYQQSITVNTLTGIAGILTLEYERATTSRATWGATVMFGGLEEERYRAARALYRFYPFEAFRGPFVGLQAGIASWANPTTDRGPHSELGADVGVTFPT